MDGKTVVITGGTSGIGQVAAEVLAGMGARIVLVARDRARADMTLARLRAKGPGAQHAVHFADLSSLSETKRVAQQIAAAERRVDVLINNAGALFSRRVETEEGLELTFATNHLSYFVLTHLLRDRLLGSVPARVINTASDAHRGTRLNFDDLQLKTGYHGFRAYSRSKLCNILFTRELAAAWPALESRPTVCTPALSPPASETRVAKASLRMYFGFSRNLRFHQKRELKRLSTWHLPRCPL